MRNSRKIISALIAVLLCLNFLVLPAYAADKNDFSATYDDSFLYLHAQKSPNVTDWYGMAAYSLEIKSSGGDLWLQLEPQSNHTLIVHNQIGYATIQGASGSYSVDGSGTGQWDIQIPLSVLEMNSQQMNIIVKMNWAGDSNTVQKAQPKDGSVSSVGNSSNNSSNTGSQTTSSSSSGVSGGIVIDGYYDDWQSIPYTIFTYHSNNDTVNHKVSVVKDDTNIYTHIKLSEYYEKQIPIDEMRYDIEGKGRIAVCLRYTNDKFNMTGLYNLSPGRHGELSPFLSGQWSDLGDAYVTIPKTGNEDELEFSINIEKLEQVMGWPKGTVNNCGKITVSLPNLGNQTVVVTGTSTAPYIGIAVSLVAIGAIVAFRKCRRRKVQL